MFIITFHCWFIIALEDEEKSRRRIRPGEYFQKIKYILYHTHTYVDIDNFIINEIKKNKKEAKEKLNIHYSSCHVIYVCACVRMVIIYIYMSYISSL
jgi:hypothetical protein